MRKKVGIVKRMLCLLLIFLLSINSFAAIVSDNDGSAFITKAEFDALKSSFQGQIDSYNQSIDSKIDGAIASYLAGIKLSAEHEESLMLWEDKTLGLVEDYRSHPYVEGQVGGKITLATWYSNNNTWYKGTNECTMSLSSDYISNSGYLSHCYHVIKGTSTPFNYLTAACGNIGSSVIWDLIGYGTIIEDLQTSQYLRGNSDMTSSSSFSIGYCSGWTTTYGTPGTKISGTNQNMVTLCETRRPFLIGDGYRGGSSGYQHNVFNLSFKDTFLSSTIDYDKNLCFLTNNDSSVRYDDVWPKEWYGTNASAGHDTHATTYDLYGAGWRMDETSNDTNFHLKVKVQRPTDAGNTDNNGVLYACDNKAYLRKWFTTPKTDAENDKGEFQIGVHNPTSATGTHINYSTSDARLKRLFKASTGSSCTENNLYSSEIGAVISGLLPSLVSDGTFDGQTKKVAPLYVGLPICEVKANDKCKINLDFIDSTDNQVGFYIDGFPSGTLNSSSAANAGCKIEGTTSHIQSVTGPANSKTITVDITKTGILFLKFGATTTSSKGTIKLPKTLTIIRE